MQFEVPDRAACASGHRLCGTQLIGDGVRNFIVREWQLSASETLEIRKTRMRADAHAVGDRQPHGPVHHVRVACMKPASDVCR